MEIRYHHDKDLIFGTRPAEDVVFLLNGAAGLGVEDPVPKHLREALTSYLRSLVDQWIDSGRGVDGVDAPLERTVYWRPLKALSVPLGDVLEAWNHRHVVDLLILPSGKRVITPGKPKEGKPFESFFSLGYMPEPENEQEAQEIAIYWLQELLDSPERYRIARCDNSECVGRYYLRERGPLTASDKPWLIKRGTYCKRCVDVASAVRVKASREQRKQKIIECAADLWEAFKPSRQHRIKSVWVAMKASRRLQLNKSITGKWVTQNQPAIEAEVERRKHGTV